MQSFCVVDEVAAENKPNLIFAPHLIVRASIVHLNCFARYHFECECETSLMILSIYYYEFIFTQPHTHTDVEEVAAGIRRIK